MLLVSLALTVVSAVEAYREISPYFVSGFSAERRFLAIAGDSYEAGNSLWSKDMLLRDCMEVSRSIYAKAQPATKRTSFLDACDHDARSMTLAMPGYARAWLVQAAVAAEQGRKDDFRSALRQAVRTAPNVHWLAERRSELAEANLDHLAPEDVAAYERDLETLLQGAQGTEVLAFWYARRPETRERLQRIVESAPPDLQARFLAEVRKLGPA